MPTKIVEYKVSFVSTLPFRNRRWDVKRAEICADNCDGLRVFEDNDDHVFKVCVIFNTMLCDVLCHDSSWINHPWEEGLRYKIERCKECLAEFGMGELTSL